MHRGTRIGQAAPMAIVLAILLVAAKGTLYHHDVVAVASAAVARLTAVFFEQRLARVVYF